MSAPDPEGGSRFGTSLAALPPRPVWFSRCKIAPALGGGVGRDPDQRSEKVLLARGYWG